MQKSRKGQPSVDLTFTSWDLAPQVTDATFVPKVPAEYEGIAIVQRAAAVKSRRRCARGGACRTGQEVAREFEPKGSRHIMKSQSTDRGTISLLLVAALVTMVGLAPIAAQVRAGRRGAVAKGDNGAAAAGPRGAAVKSEEGYAAAGRRGAVVSGEEGYAAVGRNGNVVTGEEVDVQGGAVGRRGAVVVGEEGAAAVGRYGGVVVGDRYESYDAWKAVAAVGAGIAIGTMLAKPPAAATTVVVSGSSYYYHDSVYYTKVMSSGTVDVPGRRASRRGDHHDAARRLQERARRQRDLYRSAAPRTTRKYRRDIRSSCCSEPGPEVLTCGIQPQVAPPHLFPLRIWNLVHVVLPSAGRRRCGSFFSADRRPLNLSPSHDPRDSVAVCEGIATEVTLGNCTTARHYRG